MNDFASESGHWYRRDGTPAYTIMGKTTGRMRNTTLTDARKHGLVPSVTTVSRQAAAPALEAWKMKQVLMAALTLPRVQGESDQNLVDRIIGDSREQAIAAAARGTAIHEAIEKSLAQQDVVPTFRPHALAAIEVLNDRFPGVEWESERSFASPRGFGGKVDLHSRQGTGIVVDYKTKDGDLTNVKCYDDHFMQIAAYREGLGLPLAAGANIFVARQHMPLEPVRAVLIEHSPADLARGWKMFEALLAYFYARTGLSQVSRIELAWAAGFFDGEGSTFVLISKTYTVLRMSVTQTECSTLRRFRQAVGCGKINGPQPTRRKPLFQWRARNNPEAELALRRLWPYLSHPKRRQARLALQRWNARRTQWRWKTRSAA